MYDILLEAEDLFFNMSAFTDSWYNCRYYVEIERRRLRENNNFLF